MDSTTTQKNEGHEEEVSKSTTCKLLDGYEMFGWQPDPQLTDDENYMDMVMLVTRSSHCKQGSMACVLVQPSGGSTTTTKSSSNIYESIISVATNGPIFSTEKNESDVHAEIAALGRASRTGTKTECATAYITMPPCKRCFAALVVSGIQRIVTRLNPPKAIEEGAKRHQMELVALGRLSEQMARINTLVYGDPNGKKKQTTKDGTTKVEEHPRKRTKTEQTTNETPQN
jgi:deoxycytidylate deaminase